MKVDAGDAAGYLGGKFTYTGTEGPSDQPVYAQIVANKVKLYTAASSGSESPTEQLFFGITTPDGITAAELPEDWVRDADPEEELYYPPSLTLGTGEVVVYVIDTDSESDTFGKWIPSFPAITVRNHHLLPICGERMVTFAKYNRGLSESGFGEDNYYQVVAEGWLGLPPVS